MRLEEMQRDMDRAYGAGATGVLVSGLVWCLAGTAGLLGGAWTAMLSLFFGGMLIFPLSVVLARAMGHSARHAADNGLRHLALESLALLFVGLFLAFSMALREPAFFFPIMLLAIGARYLLFQTLYGRRSYWCLGALLMLAGALCLALKAPMLTGAFAGGVIEISFALVLMQQVRAGARGLRQ